MRTLFLLLCCTASLTAQPKAAEGVLVFHPEVHRGRGCVVPRGIAWFAWPAAAQLPEGAYLARLQQPVAGSDLRFKLTHP